MPDHPLELPAPARILRLYETRITYSIEGDHLYIGTTIAEIGLDSKEKEVFSEPHAASFPLACFQDSSGALDSVLLREYCTRLANWIVDVTLNQALFRDITYHVLHSAHLLARSMKIITDSTYDEIETQLAHLHTRAVIARLRAMMGHQTIGGGRHAKWTKEALALAIIIAMRKLKPERRTQDNVAELLRAEYPERFEGAKEALKKLVRRYKLDWVFLKRHADDNDVDLLRLLSPELGRFFAGALKDKTMPKKGTEAP